MLSEEGTQCAQHIRLPQLKTEVRVTDIFCHLYEVLLIGPPKTLYAKNGRKHSFNSFGCLLQHLKKFCTIVTETQ